MNNDSMIAEVHLFTTCTHKCGYCGFAESGEVLDAKQLAPYRDPVFVEHLAAFFNRRTNERRNWTVIMTGGEPLIAPNLHILCDRLFEKGNRVAFYTSLYLPLHHANFRFLLDCDSSNVAYIMASFHPESESDEDGFFAKVARLKQAGHRIFVRFVGHPARLHRLEELDARCQSMDVCFYPTTLFSNNYPRAYRNDERTLLASYFTSLSQHLQLAGGIDTRDQRCWAGSRLVGVDMSSGDITPCISVQRPVIGNIFRDELNLYSAPILCPQPGISCLCDVHYQQGILVNVDDSSRFSELAKGYPGWKETPDIDSQLRNLENSFYQERQMGIGGVLDDGTLIFSISQLKRRHRSKPSPQSVEQPVSTRFRRRVERILARARGKSVMCYGIGRDFRDLLDLGTFEQHDIAGLLDDNIEAGTHIGKFVVRSFEELPSIQPDIVLVTTSAYSTMLKKNAKQLTNALNLDIRVM